jgi:hypothetical protein
VTRIKETLLIRIVRTVESDDAPPPRPAPRRVIDTTGEALPPSRPGLARALPSNVVPLVRRVG